MNPATLFKIKSIWGQFEANHPKFIRFLHAAKTNITQDTIIEITITKPTGETMTTNLKVTQEDLELIKTISELANN